MLSRDGIGQLFQGKLPGFSRDYKVVIASPKYNKYTAWTLPNDPTLTYYDTQTQSVSRFSIRIFSKLWGILDSNVGIIGPKHTENWNKVIWMFLHCIWFLKSYRAVRSIQSFFLSILWKQREQVFPFCVLAEEPWLDDKDLCVESMVRVSRVHGLCVDRLYVYRG